MGILDSHGRINPPSFRVGTISGLRVTKKNVLFSSQLKHVVGTQKNRLIKTVILSTHNLYFN